MFVNVLDLDLDFFLNGVVYFDDAFDFWQYLTNRHFVLPCHSDSKSLLL